MSEPIVWFPLQGDYKNIGASSLSVVPIQNGSFVSGKIGQALRMQTTGSDAFNIPELAGKQQISYAYWVKVNTATSTQWLDAVRFYLSDGSTCRQEFYTNCTRWGFWLGNEGSVSGLVYTVGEWMHVAATVDLVQHVLKVYQNGELVRTNSTLAGDGTNVITGVNMRIGENNLDISECDVRIYDTVLSDKEIHDIAQGLVLHLPMNDPVVGPIENAYSSPTFDTSAAGGGWNHWGRSGHSGSYGQNTNKAYIYNKENTYSHWVANAAEATGEYLCYQSPAFEGGYRSMQAIIKEEYSKEITTDICFAAWNGRDGGLEGETWSSIEYLGDGFYLCKAEGIHQNGSNDLIGIYVCPGYKIYISEVYLENDKEFCTPIYSSLPDLNDYPGNYNLFTGTGTNSYLSGATGTSNTATAATGKWYAGSGGNGQFGVVADASVPVGSYSWNITNNTSGNRDYGQQGITYSSEQEYTVTWWAKGNGTFQLRLWDYTSGSQRFGWTYILSSEWQHYTEHFKSNATIAGHNCNLIFGVAGKANLYMCGMKVEEGTTATKYMFAESEYETPPTVEYRRRISDASGYGHDGIILRESEIVSGSPRYECATHMIDLTPTANSDTGAYARIPVHMEGHDAITFAWWGKHKKGYNNGWQGLLATSASETAPTDYTTQTLNQYDSRFRTYNIDGTTVAPSVDGIVVENEWHYYTMTYDGVNVIWYRDGVEKTRNALTGALKPFDYIYLNFSKAGGVFRMNDGYWSDFRVYATALSEEDIKALYRTGAAIDDGQRMHTHEYVEADLQNLATPFYRASANGTLNDSYSVTFDFTNQRDTYVFFRNAVALETSKTYYVSFHAEGLADGDNVAFYVGGSRDKCDIVVHNGWNSSALTGLDLEVNSGMGLDDYQRSSSQHVTISDFRITTGVIPEIEKESKVRAAQFFDGPGQNASIFKSGDIAAADLVEI